MEGLVDIAWIGIRVSGKKLDVFVVIVIVGIICQPQDSRRGEIAG